MISGYELAREVREARALRDQELANVNGEALIAMLRHTLKLERLWSEFAFHSLTRLEDINECQQTIIRGLKVLLDRHGIEYPEMPMLDTPTSH